MKVEATAKGFFDGEVRNYNEASGKGEVFVIESRLDESAKSVDHKADIDKQYSSQWMKKV
tara:strand:+ start:65 stop:244 length:180 start_codon:yes stop_codon:yes gene_type:complete